MADSSAIERDLRSAAAGPYQIPVWQVTGSRLVFGPVQGPGVAPCAVCLERRLASQRHERLVRLSPAAAPALAQEAEDQLLRLPNPAGVALEWVDGEWRRHLALPLPGCPCGAAPLRPQPSGPLDAVSPLFGLIERLSSWSAPGLNPAEPSELVTASACRLSALGRPPSIIDGAAFGAPEQAVRAAVGEALERYCAAFVPDDLPLCAARSLGEDHLAATNESFGGAPLGADQPIRWVRGVRLWGEKPCWVQASAVYFPYVCHDDEPARSHGGSEGLAAGATWRVAVEHAAHERIERDAFMRAWRYNGPRRRLPNPYPDHDLHFALVGNRFGLPVVTAFLESDAPPLATAGIAGRGATDDAVEASAREAIGAQALFRLLTHGDGAALQARYRHAVDPDLRAARAAWCDAGDPPEDVADGLAWEALIRRIPDAVAVDVTTPDVRSLGLTVVRVVIPGCRGFEPIAGHSPLGGDPTPPPY
ncbi:MAG: YcaO-like family protein [Phenylobacterium sp.]